MLQVQFVKEKGLAGIMIWALESEDFRNSCGKGANPLLTTANAVLGRNATVTSLEAL
jgi:GH18 family chitinase